jgi:hypothetical protein
MRLVFFQKSSLPIAILFTLFSSCSALETRESDAISLIKWLYKQGDAAWHIHVNKCNDPSLNDDERAGEIIVYDETSRFFTEGITENLEKLKRWGVSEEDVRRRLKDLVVSKGNWINVDVLIRSIYAL